MLVEKVALEELYLSLKNGIPVQTSCLNLDMLMHCLWRKTKLTTN